MRKEMLGSMHEMHESALAKIVADPQDVNANHPAYFLNPLNCMDLQRVNWVTQFRHVDPGAVTG
jgi:hypothetical protein